MNKLTQLYTAGSMEAALAAGTPVGDCFRTAVACILELDHPRGFPHVIDIHERKAHELGIDPDGPDMPREFHWFEMAKTEVVKHGYRFWSVEAEKNELSLADLPSIDFSAFMPEHLDVRSARDMAAFFRCEYAIVSGKSPRGDFGHGVVAHIPSATIVHDPHPSHEGRLDSVWDFIYLFPIEAGGVRFDADRDAYVVL